MAEENDSSQEKSEQPTPRKLEKAREEGQIPRSRDLTTTFVLLAGTLGLYAFGSHIGGKLIGLTEKNFILEREMVFDPRLMLSHLGSGLMEAVLIMLPVFGMLLVASIVGPISLGGWLLSGKAMMPKLSRMNPISGLKRMFSLKALVELGKSLGKVLIILSVAVLLLWIYQQQMYRLSDMDVVPGIIHSLQLSAYAAIALAAVTIVIALIDVPFQIWDNQKKLRMSKQEIKDEMKDTDGKPEVKSRIRQLQREISQRRMMSAVPDADVVITNPTHFAVALKYDPENMATPVLLAKGADLVASKIREIARAHKIEVVEAPTLARAIYYTTELEQEIPSGLYMAVAQVLAYVFQLRNFRRGRGDKPTYPRNLNIPRDLQY